MRQVAPELVADLGEPFAELWRLLELAHGGREAGRVSLAFSVRQWSTASTPSLSAVNALKVIQFNV